MGWLSCLSLTKGNAKAYHRDKRQKVSPASLLFPYLNLRINDRSREKSRQRNKRNMAKNKQCIFKGMDLELMRVKDLQEDSPKCDICINEFCNILNKICSKNQLDKVLAPFINELKRHTKDELFRKDSQSNRFWLVEKYENLLFKTLLGGIQSATIFKYTNAHAIIYTSKNEQAMTSVIGMNDATESMYADTYLKRKGCDTYLDKDTYALYGSKAFITSFTTKKDDLTMWRLYGDDAKGIAYEYKIDMESIPENFYLAPVSYADEHEVHKELDLIADMCQEEIDKCKFSFQNLYIWKYFFKPKEYHVEDEIRLLFFSLNPQDKSEWIETGTGMIAPMKKFAVEDKSNSIETKDVVVYPMQMKRIWLGPRMLNIQSNKENISQLLKEVFGWTETDIPIQPSRIQNYRENKN